MKKLFFALVALATLTNCFAQDEPAFRKGVHIAGAGLGFPSLLGNALKSGGWDNVEAAPPVQLFYEHGIGDRVSLGASVSFSNVKASLSVSNGWSTSTYRTEYDITFIAAKGAYVFVRKPKFTFSGGLYLGYIAVAAKASSGNSSATGLASGVGYQLFLNSKYNFSKNFLAFAELGYGVSILNLGVAGQF